jgi:PD-(D/E)XK endonuclease
MPTTNQKGAIAESSIAAAAIRLGIGVLKPFSEGCRYDLVFDIDEQFFRVQCKWAVRRGDVIPISCRTARRTATGFQRTVYRRHEVDLIAAYCASGDRCYVLPPDLFDGRPEVNLRLAPTRNNQLVGVNWALDFELERLNFLPRGAIAQLGERVAGSHEVAGSSPAGSIGKPC